MNKKFKISQSYQFRSEDDAKLHNILSVKHIVALRERFERYPGRFMSRNMFRKVLSEVGNLLISDTDYEQLCKKLNFNRSANTIYWEDVLTHLRVGLDSENIENFSAKLEPPIVGAPRELRSHHRLPVIRIAFAPELQQEQSINHLYGSYITCSREGVINYWNIDMEYEKTVYSKSPQLKSLPTWITDLIVFPDVNVICTSSTERDLRFYDTSAQKFELRIIVTSLEYMVTTMYYCFYKKVDQESKFLIGDADGKVKMILIKSKDRGPFKSMPKMPLRCTTYDQFVKGSIIGMKLTDIPTEHTDWVRQISYYENIHSVVSVSTCSVQSMLIYSQKSKKESTNTTFKVIKGFSCFTIAEDMFMVITGGPDGNVRVWNPFVPTRAITVLLGHHAGIVSITIQDDYRVLISLDKDKCVKVWDVAEQVCIQTYFALPPSLGERTPLCTYYNPCSRQMFVASQKIAYFYVYPLLNGEYTDGISHSKEVSVILYNALFQTIVTCGFDSFIIIWNPWQGRRIQFIRNAHTIELQGEVLPVEITAATFDPSYQFLITGASDGTLKVWNFIVKICIRNMAVEKNTEIYAIIWLPHRILVMGENRQVTEFADSEDIGSSQSKGWMKRHQSDILCSANYPPTIMVTGSHSGELVFWRMETGQIYGMYNVENPLDRIKLQFQKESIKGGKKEKEIKRAKKKMEDSLREKQKFSLAEYLNTGTPVNALICLTSRPIHPKIGTLLAALENGTIQMWSLHPSGGYITSFKAIHNEKDFVISMCTDQNNQYLFTGHMSGYIKTWNMVNYGIPEDQHVHISMPKIRLQFPFLWKDTFSGKAKRMHKSNIPLLLNCFNAHLKPVTGIIYINEVNIIISCSSDGSARIWTLGGRYMGTLGTFKPWTYISPHIEPDETRNYTIPPDIQRTISCTSLKVMQGGEIERMILNKYKQKQDEHMCVDERRVYGKRVDVHSILGKHFSMPKRKNHHYDVILDNSLPDVPIYNTVDLSEPQVVKLPPTPTLVKNLKYQQRLTMAKIPSFHPN